MYVEEQKKSSNSGGYETSFGLAFDTNVTAGSLLVAVGRGSDTITISDNNSNTWTQISAAVANYGGVGAMWYAYNANAGATTITIDTGSTYSDLCLSIAEFSGIVSASDPLDVSTFVDETGYLVTHPTGTTSVPSQDNQLVVGGFTGDDHNAVVTAGGGLSNVTTAQGTDYAVVAMAHKRMTTAAAQSGSFDTTYPSYTNGYVSIATFKESGGEEPATAIKDIIGLGVVPFPR